jgi:hypothetical protein
MCVDNVRGDRYCVYGAVGQFWRGFERWNIDQLNLDQILQNLIVIPQISPTPYVNYANFTMNIIARLVSAEQHMLSTHLIL